MAPRTREIIRKGFYQSISFLPSTAERIRRQLVGKGVGPSEIEPAHIEKVYQRLVPLSSAPDFNLILDILPALEAVEVLPDEIVGVIIETRRHNRIEFVLENFLDSVNIPVQLFHGTENEEYLKVQLSSSIRERVRFTRLPAAELTSSAYNALLLSEQFWGGIQGRRKVLVFQTDCLPCSKSDFCLKDFCKFDYIGSNWPRIRPENFISDGGNGGLSLRDWNASVECLRRFSPTSWRGGEDGFFAFHLDLIGYRVGTSKDCDMFSTQEWFRQRSWGTHNPNCLGPSDHERFLKYCPEVRKIL